MIIMVFVRKFLLFVLTLAAFAYSSTETPRDRFRKSYYSGSFIEAHELLAQAFSDNTERQTWDERIHAWKSDITGCSVHRQAPNSIKGLALLRIGRFQEAASCFEEDWVSWLGRATLASWESKMPEAREAIGKALRLSPKNPELLFSAANLASTREQTLALYQQFLELPQQDPYRRTVVEYAIEFMKKTWDLSLNEPVVITGTERIPSEFRKGELLIHAKINGTEQVKLLLDTGSSGITVKDRDWQPLMTNDVMRLGIGKTQRNRSTQMVLHLFEAGKYQLKRPVVGVSNGMLLDGIDGIVGTVLFSNHYVLVPMKPGTDFTIFTCDNPDPLTCVAGEFTDKITVPFYWVNRLIILKGGVGPSPDDLDILLDTGAQRSILSQAAAKEYTYINYPLSKEISSKSGLSGVGGQAENVLVAENVQVRVGPMQKAFNRLTALNLGESSDAFDLELDMILGRDFLEGYTILIDYRNNRVTFLW